MKEKFTKLSTPQVKMHDPGINEESLNQYLRSPFYGHHLTAIVVLGINQGLAKLDEISARKDATGDPMLADFIRDPRSYQTALDDYKAVMTSVRESIDDIKYLNDVEKLVENLPAKTKYGKALAGALEYRVAPMMGPSNLSVKGVADDLVRIIERMPINPIVEMKQKKPARKPKR